MVDEVVDIERRRTWKSTAFQGARGGAGQLESKGPRRRGQGTPEGGERRYAVRERAQDEIELAKRSLDEFKSLHARKIIEDELLCVSCAALRGHFEGGMGAETISRLMTIDLDARRSSCAR